MSFGLNILSNKNSRINYRFLEIILKYYFSEMFHFHNFLNVSEF